uniref:Large ribosomal subunit protein bL34m n=1 Tax=Timema genevievae TaxID=629358 RepID=A0A7R9JRH6_TIMGE|nr:unnamed protein product [Timema genevievae]
MAALEHVQSNLAPRLCHRERRNRSALTNNLLQVREGIWSLMPVRTKIRVYFPRPNERRRIKRHGWNARMSTPAGRKILMNRILKGKRILSH